MHTKTSLKDLLRNSIHGAEMRYVATNTISPGPWQVRKIFKNLEELKTSIAEHGILEPLLLKEENGQYLIIGGERRWRAAQSLGLTEVPARIMKATDDQAAKMSVVENVQRESLSPIEEAYGYQNMLDHGNTQEVIANSVGKSRSHIANTIRLLKLPTNIQDMISNGKLSPTKARAMIGMQNCEEVAKQAIQKQVTVRHMEAQKRGDSCDMREIAEKLSEHLGTSVTITQKGRSGTLTIKYQSLESLDSILEVIYSGQPTYIKS